MIRLNSSSTLGLFVVVAAACAASPSHGTEAPYRSGYIPVDESLRLYYRIHGEGGEPLVLLHGGPAANFMGVGPDLVSLSERHRLIMYDQRGGGHSDRDPNAASQTVDTHVRDLETVRKFFGLEQMTLIGHSWGCTLAAYYAEQHPERVARLLLIGPMEPTRELYEARVRVQEGLQQGLADEIAALEEREELVDDPEAMRRARMALWQSAYYHDPAKVATKRGDYSATPQDVQEGWELFGKSIVDRLGDFDLRPTLATLGMPALVVEGAQSPLPLEGEWAWARALPNSRLWLIDQVGHAYPFVEQPDVFFPGVERFLRGEWPSGAQPVAAESRSNE